jgi:glycosyltransferase involved in cell wall biosynthesis
MKIVYVTASFPCGRGETFIIPEIEELRKNGHTILIIPIYPRGRLVYDCAHSILEPELIKGLFSLPILTGWIKESFRSPLSSLRALSLIISLDIPRLFKNLIIFPKGLWLARTARLCSIDHIHAHWASTPATMAMVASEASGIPWSFTAHRWDIVEDNLFEKKCRHATFTRFISKNGLELAYKLGIDTGSNAKILHMGVSLQKHIKHISKRDKPFTMLCPANLVPVKGHSELFDAIANIIEKGIAVRLWIAGDGPLRSALKLRVRIRHLNPYIKFLGQMPHSRLISLYERGEVDTVVLYSLDLGNGLHEGIPVALIEAMAFGIPVVSTKTGGIPELLENGAGLLVSPADPKAFADAVIQIIRSPVFREQVGKRGKQKVTTEFSIQEIGAILTEWFLQAKRT